MALEPTFNFIEDLVAANPASLDNLSQADDHLRGIKSSVLGSFTSLGNVACTATAAELNTLAGNVTGTDVDADTLGGVAGTDFLNLTMAETITGQSLTLNPETGTAYYLADAATDSASGMVFYENSVKHGHANYNPAGQVVTLLSYNGANKSYLSLYETGQVLLRNEVNTSTVQISADGDCQLQPATSQKAYIGSVTADNEIATAGTVDSNISDNYIRFDTHIDDANGTTGTLPASATPAVITIKGVLLINTYDGVIPGDENNFKLECETGNGGWEAMPISTGMMIVSDGVNFRYTADSSFSYRKIFA